MRAADEDIIRQVLNGNRQAYAVLVDKYKDRVFSLALGIVRNRELAEEIAQDTFVKAYSSLKKFRKEAGFSTWIYRITYNTAISEMRKQKHKIRTVERVEENLPSADTSVTMEELEEKEEKHKLIEQAIDELFPEEKLILTLYYYEENSVEQISKATGLTPSNVKVKLFRIRHKLREIAHKLSTTEPAIY